MGRVLRVRYLIATVAVLATSLAVAACGDDDGDGARTPSASAGATFVISPGRGEPDARIVVSGCGFAPNTTVQIEATVLDARTAETDASGAFRIDTYVPSVGPGTYIVRASTSDDVFAEAVFTVDRQTGDTGNSPTPQPSPELARC